MKKFWSTGILALVLAVSTAGSAFAQDFNTLVSQASAANQQWVSQIATANQATSLAALQSANATALATGTREQTLLQQALAIAPDDASRSRVQGVLQHVTAALQDGQAIQTASSLSVGLSDLNGERGEAVEAQNEIVPFAGTTPPATLPVTGGPGLLPVFLFGLAASIAGAGVRSRAASRSRTA